MNDKEFEELLKTSLQPNLKPDSTINDEILKANSNRVPSSRRKLPRLAVASIIAANLLLSAIPVYAAVRLLSAPEVAQKVGDLKLSEAFRSEDAMVIREARTCGEYRFTLLGYISGEQLSDYEVFNAKHLTADRSYAIVAVERINGEPMPELLSDEYNDLHLYASFYISGYDPMLVNISSLNGGNVTTVEDGIRYEIISINNIEAFADHTISIGITKGLGPDSRNVRPNEEYPYNIETFFDGEPSSFVLPFDVSLADAVKADQILQNILNEPSSEPTHEEQSSTEVVSSYLTMGLDELMSLYKQRSNEFQFHSEELINDEDTHALMYAVETRLQGDLIAQYASSIEGSRKECQIESDNNFHYEFSNEYEDLSFNVATSEIYSWCPVGVKMIFRLDMLHGTLITCTRIDDSTIIFEMYHVL